MKFSWSAPTQNSDGSPIQSTEITGYDVGVRDPSAAGSAIGTYPFLAHVVGNVTQLDSSAFTPPLPLDRPLMAAVRTDTGEVDANNNPVDSPWTAEISISIVEIPGAPTNFSFA